MFRKRTDEWQCGQDCFSLSIFSTGQSVTLVPQTLQVKSICAPGFLSDIRQENIQVATAAATNSSLSRCVWYRRAFRSELIDDVKHPVIFPVMGAVFRPRDPLFPRSHVGKVAESSHVHFDELNHYVSAVGGQLGQKFW